VIPWSLVWVVAVVLAGVVSFLAAVAQDLERQRHELEVLGRLREAEARHHADPDGNAEELIDKPVESP